MMETFIRFRIIKFSLLILVVALSLYSCIPGFHKKNRLIDDNQKGCNTLHYLKLNFKNGFNHSSYKSLTNVNLIGDEKIAIIQDTIQIILEKDTLGFSDLLKDGLINGQTLSKNLEFLVDIQKYEEKELPSIKRTFSIFGITELHCDDSEIGIKKFTFSACIGDIPTNGIIYYLELKQNLNEEIDQTELIYLQNFGIMI